MFKIHFTTFPERLYHNIPSKSRSSTAYRARITGLKLLNSVLYGLYQNTENIATKLTFQLITLAILKQSRRIVFQNRYIKEINKSSKNSN
jgi:hypothetical protein